MSRDSIDDLVERYKGRGALVDSNLLLMYCIGEYDVRAMQRFKRIRAYGVRDLTLMRRLLSLFKRIVTTPNILTEVSNLAGQLGDGLRAQFLSHLGKTVEILTEEYCPSATASQHQYFAKCGLTDSAIMEVARANYLVITDDFRLANMIEKQGIDVINFEHVRSSYLLKG